MKRLVIINLILIIIIYLIPLKEKDVENIIKEEIEEPPPAVALEVEVTSRHNTPRPEPIQKITTLAVDSDLRQISNLTGDEFNKMLEGTALYGIGNALAEAEIKHNINGLYLMGLACLESGYGTSKYAIERNNLVGWNAVDSNPNKATYFTSKSECISFVASKLKVNYLSEDGRYFEGFTARDIDKHYCSDKKHADKIIQIVNKLTKKL